MISANLLIARFDITFNHETFYQFMKFRIDHTTVKNFFGDTNLLFILFVGVGVVGVYDNCRVLEILFLKDSAYWYKDYIKNNGEF